MVRSWRRDGTGAARRCRLRLNVLEDRGAYGRGLPGSIDGTGNNLPTPTWGSAGTDLLRIAPAAYADGVSTPAGAEPAQRPGHQQRRRRPGRRGHHQRPRPVGDDLRLGPVPRPRPRPDRQRQPGRAVQHRGPGRRPVVRPEQHRHPGHPADPLGLRPGHRHRRGNPRQQVNQITAWIDGSMVYGSDAATAPLARLRHAQDQPGNAARPRRPPRTTAGLPSNDAHVVPTTSSSLAGDVRANENIELTALQTLFVREHNRIADQIAQANPTLTDETSTRRPAPGRSPRSRRSPTTSGCPPCSGRTPCRPYRGYNPNVNPGIANEFSTAAFRLGHSMLGDDVEFFDNDGRRQVARRGRRSREAFFNPALLQQTGIDPILKYLASDPSSGAGQPDRRQRAQLPLRPAGRGRARPGDAEHPARPRPRPGRLQHDPGRLRPAAGDELRPDHVRHRRAGTSCKQLYGTVNNIDLWVGGPGRGPRRRQQRRAADPRAILADQFKRLRDGDRFWYQRIFSGAAAEDAGADDPGRRHPAQHQRHDLQDNVFFFKAEVSGQVFVDRNGDGRPDRGEAASPA